MFFRNELELSELLDKHKALYENGTPEIPDRVFDHLEMLCEKAKLRQDDDAPLFADWKPKRGKAIQHETPMPSVNRTYEIDGILKKLTSKIKDVSDVTFTVEAKYDGVAFSSQYRNGLLMYVATRGNYLEGEDITAFLVHRGTLPSSSRLDNFEIRGELYVSKADFNKYNRMNTKKYTTPQHLAAAAIHDPTIKVTLRYVVYRCIGESFEPMGTNSQRLREAKIAGFDIVKFVKARGHDVNEVVSIMYKHYTGGYFKAPLDGIVIKFNEIALQEELGSTVRKPRWSVAYKFPSESAKSVIREIRHQITMEGEQVPIAKIDPVVIGGRTASGPSLYNYAVMNAFNNAVGKQVLVESTGGTVFTIKPDPDAPRVKDAPVPRRCTACKSKIVKRGDKIFCSEPEKCSGTKLKRFSRFYGRNGVDVKGLGEKKLEEYLRDFPLLNYPEDLYKLCTRGNTIDSNTYDLMQDAHFTPLNKLLIALTIPGVGETHALEIQKFVGDMPFLEFCKKRAIVKKISEPLHDWLVAGNAVRLKRLAAIGYEVL